MYYLGMTEIKPPRGNGTLITTEQAAILIGRIKPGQKMTPSKRQTFRAWLERRGVFPADSFWPAVFHENHILHAAAHPKSMGNHTRGEDRVAHTQKMVATKLEKKRKRINDNND
jgi:hypothetical protein